MKQPTNKPATNPGYNNPTEDIKNIEFTNSAIEKLKIEDFKINQMVHSRTF
jgi:hypothetical protein